jgi:sugar phosphate isomerase/epimerase
MRIGVSSKPIGGFGWLKRIPLLGSGLVEINHRHCYIPFDTKYLEIKKKYYEGYSFSMHSWTRQVMFDSEGFVTAETSIIRAEAELLSRLGGTELITHLGKGEWTEAKLDSLRGLIKDCKAFGVDLIFESGLDFAGDFLFLKKIPELKYNLDLGHFHMAIKQDRLGCTADEFLNEMNERIVYCHAHNNDGVRDRHWAVTKGDLDWRSVLSRLTNLKTVIVEVNEISDIKPSVEALQDFFSSSA